MSELNNAVVVPTVATVKAEEVKAELTAELAAKAKEAADRKAAQERHVAGQERLKLEIGEAYVRMEFSRSKDNLTFCRKLGEFVNNALMHASEKSKAKELSRAIGEVETFLREFTDESVGVSRLLGIYGLSLVTDNPQLISSIPVSTAKILLPLIKRDETAPGLAYVWANETAMKDGPALIQKAADGKLTVKAAIVERDKILAPVASDKPLPADKPDEPTGPRTPVEKAASGIRKALKSLGDDTGVRCLAVRRLVKTKILKPLDIMSALEEMAATGKLTDLRKVLAAGKLMYDRAKAKADAEKPADKATTEKVAP